MSDITLATQAGSELRVIAPKQTVRQQLRDMWRYRELLGGMVRKELKVKYKDSVLGFVWSLLNPALYLVVYYVVFQVILGNGIVRYPIYLLSGLLVWNFFSSAIAGSCGAVVGNSSIVKKVAFPREILALANTGASLVHFFLQSVVLLGALAVFAHAPSPEYMTLLPLALLAIVILAAGLGILLSAVNVKLRDTQHLLELIILVWFWATPIVYQYEMVVVKMHQHHLSDWIYRINPVTPIVLTFQRALYNDGIVPRRTYIADGHHILPTESVLWYAGQLAWVIALGIALFVFALRMFGRMQADFAEEL